MEIFQNSVEKLKNFFLIDLRKEDFCDEIFQVLKQVIDFESAYIFYTALNVQKLVFSYNSKLQKDTYTNEEKIDYVDKKQVSVDLMMENSPFGKLVLSRNQTFSKEEKNILETLSFVIASQIKNAELNNIIQMQIKAQHEVLEELNSAYSTIKKQNTKIIKADKIKNDFLSHVSHELRTPLNSIIGFSDLLESRCIGELNDKQADYVNDIKISGLHLLGMINEILDISKLESNSMKLNLSQVDIERVITETINVVKPLAMKKNIEIKFKNEAQSIPADYQKIQQILFNLLSNSIKFTGEAGKINIQAKQDKKYLSITVKDSGVGIDKKYHKKIFKKFEQGENISNQSSTGLGLTITAELVKLHNGKITLKSEKGHGAEFEIKLPC